MILSRYLPNDIVNIVAAYSADVSIDTLLEQSTKKFMDDRKQIIDNRNQQIIQKKVDDENRRELSLLCIRKLIQQKMLNERPRTINPGKTCYDQCFTGARTTKEWLIELDATQGIQKDHFAYIAKHALYGDSRVEIFSDRPPHEYGGPIRCFRVQMKMTKSEIDYQYKIDKMG